MNSFWVCIDANLVVRMTTSRTYGLPVWDLWRQWRRAGCQIAAPTLMCYEVSNALRRYVAQGALAPTDADESLEVALGLGIRLFGDPDLHRRALRLAAQLALPAAYDAHYLALAERLGAEMWTADRRLHRAVADALTWVRMV